MTERSTGDLSHMRVRSRIGPFEIRYPPVKKHMVAGHMVPTLRKFLMAKKRKISIEVLSPALAEISRIEEDLGGGGSLDALTSLEDGEVAVVRIFRMGHGDDDDEDSPDDDESVAASVSGLEFMDPSGKTWSVQRELKTDDIEVLKGSSKVIEVKVGGGNDTIVRDLKFQNTPDADQFEKGLARVKELEKQRAQKQIASYKASTSTKSLNATSTRAIGDALDVGDNVNILVEIVSAINLPAADLNGSSDPYCVVRMKGKDIHRTKVLKKTLQPIWVLETGSLFLIKCTTEEFFASSSGITFTVKDYDIANADDILATVSVPLKDALEGTGERTEYPMTLDKSFKGKKAPTLFLRFKPASEDDAEFMDFVADSSKKHGAYANETFLPLIAPEVKFLKRQEKKGANGEILHRVKPGPDPERPEEATKWLTEEKINEESLKPSKNWVEAGSGNVGKVYMEVIKCDDLPNMDATTLNLSDKTDAFCCIVFEDCIVNTEVIGNTLNPRWPCWSQRAFVFNVSSPSSSIFLGVYDHDPEKGAAQMIARAANASVHDAIGRVVINLTNFRPNTEYYLDYSLYEGELAVHRQKPRGTISIRIRLEFDDIRDSLVKSLNVPKENIVAVARKIDYDVANYAADGAVDDSAFAIATLTGYLDELAAYESVVDIITEALMTVWLWRCHPVTLFGKQVKVPMHSFTAFVWGIVVTWNFDRFPAFFLFSIAWILLACNDHVRQHPSRWNHAPSYPELMRRLILGSVSSEMMTKNTNAEEIKNYESLLQEKISRRKIEKEEEAAQEAKLQEEVAAELEKAEEAEGVSKKKSPKFDVVAAALKPHLYPVQKQLRVVVQCMRITKNVFRWGEAYYTFWIVNACFASALLAYFVPWSFLFRWTLRIVVFVALGPWMYLVDKYYFKTDPNMTKEEQDAAFRRKMQARYDEVMASASVFMIRKENAMKMQCMKSFFFGKYLLHVPQFREDLFDDIPLPSSHCAPYQGTSPVVPKQRKFGQTLEGAMIPKREVQVEKKKTTEKVGQKRGIRGLVSKANGSSKAALEKVPLLGKSVFSKRD